MEDNENYEEGELISTPEDLENEENETEESGYDSSDASLEGIPAEDEGASLPPSAPPPKANFRDKFAEVNKTNFKLQHETTQLRGENSSLRAEIERLQKLADVSTETALSHYDTSSTQRLEMAKQLKAQAYESGDIEAQTKADIELINAAHARQELLNMKARAEVMKGDHYKITPPPSSQDTLSAQQQYELNRWVSRNPWFNPQASNYHEPLANAVQTYAEQYEQHLHNEGYGHLIGSPAYYDALDGYVNQLRNSSKQQRGIDMHTPRNKVGAVRQGGAPLGANSSAKTPPLAEMHREMAQIIGMPVKEYEKYVKMTEAKDARLGGAGRNPFER